MPQWLAPISMLLVGDRVEAGAPVDDAVAARVDGHEPHAGRERRREVAPERSQHSPSRHARLNRPGAPSEPSRLTASTPSRTSGCTASGSTCAEPECDEPQTRSGRRTASTLAMLPPRLCPITTARWPCRRPGARAAAQGRSCPAPARTRRSPASRPATGGSRRAAASRPSAPATVAGHEAGDQQRGAAAAVAQTLAAEDRVADQRGRFQPHTGLPPERRTGADRMMGAFIASTPT